MKTLTVMRLAEGTTDASQVHRLMDEAAVSWQAVDQLNWPSWRYRPDVRFRLAHDGGALYVEYAVREATIRAAAEHDAGAVWEDSCCEIFLQECEDTPYYNIECNCAGTLLVACGADRHAREVAPQAVFEAVGRCSSLGSGVWQEREAPDMWTLALVIPVSTFFRSHVDSLTGRTLRANVYKCGDALTQPHFLSWNKIDTPQPDFHRPEFFGELRFA